MCSPERWLTPALLHNSFSHLLGNALLLLAIGLLMEVKHGTWRIAAIAVLSAVAANLLRCVPLVGRHVRVSDACCLAISAKSSWQWHPGRRQPPFFPNRLSLGADTRH
jgi:membrane associated rhomboid family serine protease